MTDPPVKNEEVGLIRRYFRYAKDHFWSWQLSSVDTTFKFALLEAASGMTVLGFLSKAWTWLKAGCVVVVGGALNALP